MSGRERRSRRSAIQAKKFFKEIGGDDSDVDAMEDGGETVSALNVSIKTKKKRKSDDSDFEGSCDGSGYVNSNNGNSTHEQEDEIDMDAENDLGRTKSDDNLLTKKRKEVLEIWKEYFTPPSSGLKEVPIHLIELWKKLLPKKLKKGQKKNKPVKCPNVACDKKFIAGGGLAYHYQRCGVDQSNNKVYKCNMCPFISTVGVRMIIPHLVANHLEQLPVVPSHLAEALVYKKVVRGPSETKAKKSTFKTFVAFDDYIEETKSYHIKNQNLGLFPELMPRIDNWKPKFSSMNMPQEEISLKFKFKSTPNSSWMSLNLFDTFIDNVNGHHTFYVGGPVWSAAWCPYPTCNKVASNKSTNVVEDQVLAISAGVNFDAVHPFSDLEPEPGLIQFWNFGKLDARDYVSNGLRMDTFTQPNFEFGIAHNYGLVWDMEWCPFGNTFESVSDYKAKIQNERPNILPRLGLLAMACGDGYVRIMSIPHPASIIKNQSNLSINDAYKKRIFAPQPIIILCPPGVGPATNNLTGICKCLSWSRTRGSVDIAAGYGNGIVAAWNLKTKSKLLIVRDSDADEGVQKRQLQLLPTNSWIAHPSSVNSVKWCPYEGSKILATGGTMDRMILLWNFDDLNVPIRILKRGYITDIDWIFRFSGLFASFDDCFLSLKSNTNYVELAEEDVRNTLSPHRSTVWSLSYSDWLNSEASADSSGECLIFHDFHYKVKSNSRWKRVRKEPLYRIQLVPFSEPANEVATHVGDSVAARSKDDAKKTGRKKKKNPKVVEVNQSTLEETTEGRLKPNSDYYSYEGMTKEVGIVFVDHSLDKDRVIDKKETERLHNEKMNWVNPSHYPLSSINQIRWNPNYASYTFIFTGTQSGLCRISNCQFLGRKKKLINNEGDGTTTGNDDEPTLSQMSRVAGESDTGDNDDDDDGEDD